MTQATTPLMKQYLSIKKEYADAVVLFQVGDFYELFFNDAQVVSQFLGIALTKRGHVNGQPIPLCGFPVHAVQHYIPKLIKGGFKLAICDQIEPAVAGKMVARAVTNVLTPGTLISENLLDAKNSSYLFSFFPTKSGYGLLFSELVTMQLHATVIPFDAMRQLETELFRFLPDEVILLAHKTVQQYESFFKDRGFCTTLYQMSFDQAVIDQETLWLKQVLDQESFEQLSKCSSLLYATIIWKKYIERNQQQALSELKSIQFYQPENFLMLDAATQKNLDIVKNSFDNSKTHTLFGLMDKAVTPMGSRMIKRWLLSPLMEQAIIQQRQSVVDLFVKNNVLMQRIERLLVQCGDMQRIVGRIALQKALLADYISLAQLLVVLPELKQILLATSSMYLQAIAHTFQDFSQLQDLLTRACNVDAHSDDIIKSGFNPELDSMRDLVRNSNQKIFSLEQQEIARTGINSLKIRHNNIAGYYIEITNTHADAIPQDFIQNATLANRKRFTTKTLQALQFEILHAEKQYAVLEKELFEQVKNQVKVFVHDLRILSFSLAQLDALLGFAKVAYEQSWTCPMFHENTDIVIEGGKHPIIASQLFNRFIANDTMLNDAQSVLIITGPNMGGKSTYLRQVALISILAQAGSFVPAASAQLPILDRIFTRIGAGDFLAQGKSTFLIEMEETAQILEHATSRSLIILDEVGRGTSTYDGLALAQAIIEHIFVSIKARCLFATHYHELALLEQQYDGIANFYADSVQTDAGIMFLHKIVKGHADGSFGLEVARLARIPNSVVVRASMILKDLAKKDIVVIPAQKYDHVVINASSDHAFQSVQKKIKSIDFDTLNAKQAYDLLWEIKDLV